MKKLSLLIACGISLTGLLMSVSSALAKNDASNIHIDHSRQSPETRWANADHYLQIHVPRNSAAMSVLSFQVPENLRFDAKQVEIFDLQGQKILARVVEEQNTQVTPVVRTIELNFSTLITSGRQVELRIRNVQKVQISRPSSYSISAKLTGSDQERYVGEAYFRSY